MAFTSYVQHFQGASLMLLCPLLPWWFPRTCRRSSSNGKKNEPQSFLSMTLIYIHSSFQEQDPNPYIYVYITPRTLLYVFTSEDKVLVYMYNSKDKVPDYRQKKALFRTRPVRQTSYCFDVSIYIYRYICRYVRSIFFLSLLFNTHIFLYTYILHYITIQTVQLSMYIYIFTSGDKVLVYIYI